MNNTDTVADQLRAALKTAGYNARKVTVRHEHYSMGSTIHITIRDASVSKAKIEEIAQSFERVDRDQWGDILSGANRFVRVKYDRKVEDAMVMPIAEMLAAAEMEHAIEINGHQVVKTRDGHQVFVRSLGESPRLMAYASNGNTPAECRFAASQIAQWEIGA